MTMWSYMTCNEVPGSNSEPLPLRQFPTIKQNDRTNVFVIATSGALLAVLRIEPVAAKGGNPNDGMFRKSS